MFVSTPENLSPQACSLRVSTGNFSLICTHGPWLGLELTCLENSQAYGWVLFKTILIGLKTWDSLNSGYWPNGSDL